MTTDKQAVLTPQEVLRRLKKDMPQNAPIRENGDIVGYEANGIEGALNQLLSYDKDAVLVWLQDSFPAGVD